MQPASPSSTYARTLVHLKGLALFAIVFSVITRHLIAPFASDVRLAIHNARQFGHDFSPLEAILFKIERLRTDSLRQGLVNIVVSSFFVCWPCFTHHDGHVDRGPRAQILKKGQPCHFPRERGSNNNTFASLSEQLPAHHQARPRHCSFARAITCVTSFKSALKQNPVDDFVPDALHYL